MSNTIAAFTIYNASAGSGKTYTLVKNYLLKILSSDDKGRFKKILAVTFTNKAVAEMKERILSSLHHFSQSEISKNHESMFLEIQDILNISSDDLKKKSKDVLHFLLHNYTAFNVQTIDKFTQSVIRTFAFDLNLNTNFEVELDSKSILEQSVDELLNKVGEDTAITKIILDFMKSNINEDSAWNIKNSLLDISGIILNENDAPHLKLLETKTIEDFNGLKTNLQQLLSKNTEVIIKRSKDILATFESKGIIDDFNRNTIPNHFKKLSAEGTVKFSEATKWQNDIENYNFYTKSCSPSSQQKIDDFRPQIIALFYETKAMVFQSEYILRVLKNITQMSLLRTIYNISETLKKENNILLISDFNQLIFETIKDQPAPFIYERLGEKYKDFFIDEFQDTSVMQWRNLIPLADNALSSEIENSGQTGSVTLVGDAKQAIYRWRGGKAEQFIDLYQSVNPFPSTRKVVENLDTNFRSYSAIITFNNNFFTYLASQFLSPIYKQLYIDGNQQKTNSREGGYVQFDFINGKNAEEKNELYLEKTLEVIHQVISNGFRYRDISILVRTNNQGVLLANYLNEQHIPIISSESLLLQNSNVVELLISYAHFITNTGDKAIKLFFLKALSIYLEVENTHHFLSRCINLGFEQLQNYLHDYSLLLPVNPFNSLSIYEAFEHCIASFKLHLKTDAYLQFFMDFVFEYAYKTNLGVIDFLEYWETKKEKTSIVTPKGKNAVQILSIHKSKGLEYPVVIYPFADTEVYKTRATNLWLPIHEFSEVFSEAYVSYNKNLFETYSDDTRKAKEEITALQELDNFNVLYVALTRAKEQLYIISNNNQDSKKIPEGSFQSYFLDFLASAQFEKLDDTCFFKGIQARYSKLESEEQAIVLESYINSEKISHGIVEVISSAAFSEAQQKAIEKGKIFHEVFSKIKDRSDVEVVLEYYQDFLDKEDYELLKINTYFIINSDYFNSIFKKSNTIYNEREFAYEGKILRPDRVEIDDRGTIYIIDYKTGAKDSKYLQQIEEYSTIFKDFNEKTIKKYIIYIGDHPEIEELS